ncbi:MAG: glycerol-3-phosphate 1-O-acyltransferase PlsY [Rickettsiales bacterium]|nr:glycerol-3-phosphate 1-O-acyltransferase PlsY [Rickettsiales bacterium]
MTGEFMIRVLSGYLIGSIPSGFILARLLGLGDLRKTGSGGTGATNAMRVGGLKLAFCVFALDLSKAFVAAGCFGIWAGLFAVLGHDYPVWLKFKGGKGVSSSAGFVLAVCPPVFVFLFPIWLIVALSFGYSSLAALTVLTLAPLLGFAYSVEVGGALVLLAMVGFWRHKENIRRLLNGTESKIKWKRK